MCFYFLFCLKYLHIPLFGHLQLTCLSLLSPTVLYLFNISNLNPSFPSFCLSFTLFCLPFTVVSPFSSAPFYHYLLSTNFSL
ncbi:hypothetical protein FKM82_031202 [Ascaphus truei]